MCNLYRMRTGAADILSASRAMSADVGNLEPRDIYPDYAAPIVRNGGEGRELVLARWGLPSSSQAMPEATPSRSAQPPGTQHHRRHRTLDTISAHRSWCSAASLQRTDGGGLQPDPHPLADGEPPGDGHQGGLG